MPNFTPFIILGVILLVIAVFAIGAHIWEKRRTEAFKQLADELSFDFFPTGRAGLLSEMTGFYLFGIGHSQTIFNLLQGTAGGLQISIFDYRYVTGSGKNRKVSTQSVFVAHREGMDLPMFTLRPENIWHKIGSMFGMQDIDFESHPKFSKRYLLKGPDEEAIRELFTPEVLDFFEQKSGLTVEGSGDVLLYSTYKRLSPDSVRQFMADGFEILNLFQPAEDRSGERG